MFESENENELRAPAHVRRAVSIDDAVKMLGVSRSLIYRQMRAGHLATIKFGARRLIPMSEIERLSKVDKAS